MKKYLSFFRLRFIMGLQYRAGRNRYSIRMGNDADHDIPCLLPDGQRRISDDAVGYLILHLAPAGVSGLLLGLDDGK